MDCEPKRYAPRLELAENDIEGLADMKIKKTYTMTIKARLVALREDEWGYSDDYMRGTFRIESINGKNINENYDEEDDSDED